MSQPSPTSSADVVQASDIVASTLDLLFIEVRLGDPPVELERYREGHIIGAVYAQIRDVFAGVPTARSGNLPLPSLADLERRLLAWGVTPNTEIVLYGPSPAIAARGWWTLRWAGLERVRILDGGLKAWVESGGAVAQGDAPPRKPSFVPLNLPGGRMPTINVDAVESLGGTTRLIDARDESAYEAGHIPGATSLPAADLWSPSGYLRPSAAIQRTFDKTELSRSDDVVAYCGGGVLSALTTLALRNVGIDARLYVGSWSEWSKDANRLLRAGTATGQA